MQQSSATVVTVKGHIPSTFPAPRISQSTHHLLCFSNALLQTPRGDDFQHSSHAPNPHYISISPTILSTELNQPCQLLQERLSWLDHPSHLDELRPDDRVLNQLDPERLPCTSMLPRIFRTHSTQSDSLSSNTFPLCIEIGHDDFETTILLVDQVLDRNPHIFESDECAPRCTNTRVEHLSG